MNDLNPYTAPTAAVSDPYSDSLALAGRGTRLGAAIIDGILLLVILMPMMWMGGYWSAATAAAAEGRQVSLGLTILWALIGLVVFVVVQGYPLNATGQTWGKKLLGIRIADMQGAKPPLAQLLLKRYVPLQVVGAIPMVGPLLALVNCLLIFRSDKRCGHDLIAGTQVLKGLPR